MTLNNKNRNKKPVGGYVVSIDDNARRVIESLKEKARNNKPPYRLDVKRAVSAVIVEHLGGVNG